MAFDIQGLGVQLSCEVLHWSLVMAAVAGADDAAALRLSSQIVR